MTCNLVKHSERRFCCAGCGRAFSSVSIFDAHRRTVDDRRVCLDPETLVDKAGKPRASSSAIPGLVGSVVVWGARDDV